jgi:hypothetical protein
MISQTEVQHHDRALGGFLLMPFNFDGSVNLPFKGGLFSFLIGDIKFYPAFTVARKG